MHGQIYVYVRSAKLSLWFFFLKLKGGGLVYPLPLIVYKDISSGFWTHDLSHEERGLLSLDQRLFFKNLNNIY